MLLVIRILNILKRKARSNQSQELKIRMHHVIVNFSFFSLLIASRDNEHGVQKGNRQGIVFFVFFFFPFGPLCAFMIIIRKHGIRGLPVKNKFHFDKWFCFLLIFTKSEIRFRMHEKSYKIDKVSDKYCASFFFLKLISKTTNQHTWFWSQITASLFLLWVHRKVVPTSAQVSIQNYVLEFWHKDFFYPRQLCI